MEILLRKFCLNTKVSFELPQGSKIPSGSYKKKTINMRNVDNEKEEQSGLLCT